MTNNSNMLCNLCGEAMNITPYNDFDNQNPLGLVNAKVVGVYESYHLLDMNCYEFSLCEKCLRQLFMQCKIKPIVHDEIEHRSSSCNVDTSICWEQDQLYYEQRLWQDSEEYKQVFANGKCNAKKGCMNNAVAYIDDIYSPPTDSFCEEHKTGNRKYIDFSIKWKPKSLGEILNEKFLVPLKLSPKDFADKTKLSEEHIVQILNGNLEINEEIAAKFEAAIDIPEGWCLEYQVFYNKYKDGV